MRIEFPFNFEKAAGAMAYIVGRLHAVDKVKLMKLLYIADRTHFLTAGHPITGSRQVAMDKGPLPTTCLDVLDGQWGREPDAVFRFIHLDNYSVTLRDDSATAALDAVERQTLDKTLASFGSTPTWDLVNQTHRFPEFEAVYVVGTSRTISYESLLRLYGGPERFRFGRPVVTEAMSVAMECPFTPNADADL